jgi:uncharacterized protein YecT (DUF1311 family)
MKTKTLIAVALLCISFAGAGLSQTQREMNEDAFAGLERAEVELTRVYQKALKWAESDPVLVNNLRKAQRAWIVFRDAHLEAIFPAEKRYSARSMAAAIVQTELTEARIEQLKGWAEGIEEGDITAGTRQTFPAPTYRE